MALQLGRNRITACKEVAQDTVSDKSVSGSSPTFSRDCVKKTRIASRSTENTRQGRGVNYTSQQAGFEVKGVCSGCSATNRRAKLWKNNG